MQAHRALTALVLTVLLSVGALFPALTPPIVHAESNQGESTLYFTDALGFLENENLSEMGFTFLSPTPPTKQNDSQYPPNLFIKNTSRFLPRYESNANQWVTWFTTTWALAFFEGLDDENLSDLFNLFGILLPSPFRVVEGYTYTGNETITIDGSISYNLFFEQPSRERINRLLRLNDKVEIGLYSMNPDSVLPTLIKKTNITLETKGQPNIYKQPITLPNVNYKLAPGDSLLFSVEIIPTNKTFSNWIKKHLDIQKIETKWLKIASFLENRTSLTKIQDIGTAIKDILSAVEESQINITSDDIASIYNAIVSSKLVYDSVSHPSSVTIPANIIEEDIRDFFIGSNQEMSETRPNGTATQKSQLGSTPLIWKTTQGLNRNKILTVNYVTAELYFYRWLNILPKKVSVTVTLYDENTTIATSERVITTKETNGFLRTKITPIIFTFSGVDREITYGHHLGFGISLGNGTKRVITPLKIQYGSIDYSSFLHVKFEETRNIQIRDSTATPADGKIIPGGSVLYFLNVTSVKADSLQISTIEREKTGMWVISTPTSVPISANSSVGIPVFVNSTNNLNEAYDSTIDLIVVIAGNTGIARTSVSAEISKDAIRYNIELLGYTPNINMSKGESKTFYFVIKNNNTGAIDDVDSYTVTATSQHGWKLIPRGEIRDVLRGATTDPTTARVDIDVPKNTTAKTDIITITVTSKSESSASATINVTVHVLGGGFFESLFDIFDSAAKSIGLGDIFGNDAAFVLAGIIVVIILFLFIILALVLTIKPVHLICTDRIKEIELTEKALYELSLQNPQKKQQTYEIFAEHTAPSNKWIISIEPLSICIEGRQTQTILVAATPTEQAEPGDWTQVTVRVKKTGKKNAQSITLMAMLKEGKTLLQLSDVSHWPREFTPGEKVTTSFSILNNGTLTARNVNAFFYLNGKQKHKIVVTIPAGSAADIQVPWIAIKGKNKVRIRLKEQ